MNPFLTYDFAIVVILAVVLEIVTLRKKMPFNPMGSLFLVLIAYTIIKLAVAWPLGGFNFPLSAVYAYVGSLVSVLAIVAFIVFLNNKGTATPNGES